MSNSAKRAAKSAGKDTRKRELESDSDSSDGSLVLAAEGRKRAKIHEKEMMRAKDREKALRRELAEIEARNEAASARIVDARNAFPV
jgi:hypothetical protein